MGDTKNTVALDYDGTLVQHTEFNHQIPDAPPVAGAVQAVHDLYYMGYRLVVLTARPASQVWPWLATYGITGYFDEVTNTKPPAVRYVDDKAGGQIVWPEIVKELRHELAAHGTPDGASKAWDTRGRGRKDKGKTQRPPAAKPPDKGKQKQAQPQPKSAPSTTDKTPTSTSPSQQAPEITRGAPLSGKMPSNPRDYNELSPRAQAKLEPMKLTETSQRAWPGTPVELKGGLLSKVDQGDLGERIVYNYLNQQPNSMASFMNLKDPSGPIDMLHNGNTFLEIKTGNVTAHSQTAQWRVTLGQPSKALQEKMSAMSKPELRAFNKGRSDYIMGRKVEMMQRVTADFAKQGIKISPVARTIAVIVNHETQHADLFQIEGHHARLGYGQPIVKYLTSVRYK